MKSLKKLAYTVVATVAVLGSALPGQASAGIVNLTLTGGVAIPSNALTVPTTAYYGNTLAGSGASFDDYVNFSISSAAALSNATESISLGGFSGLTSLKARLYTGTTDVAAATNVVGVLNSTNTQWVVSTNPASTLSLSVLNASSLAAGNYVLEIYGTALPTALSASYSGTINVAAVPEPQGLLLTLAGLSVAALMVRRRRI